METARESNPVATVLAALFKTYRNALEVDRESTALNVAKTNKAVFLERYQLNFLNEETIKGALTRDLFIAIKRLAKDFGLSFHMNSVQQFAQRFSNDLDTIRQVGFDITVNRLNHSVRCTAAYDITYIARSLFLSRNDIAKDTLRMSGYTFAIRRYRVRSGM